MSTVENKMNMSAQSPLENLRDRLDCWKEIAVYLDREVRTVQRWEKCEGLPVHRQFHVKAGTVCAFKHEIDTWLKIRCHPSSKALPHVPHSNPSVHWSCPMQLVKRRAGNSCWLWLMVIPSSQLLENGSGVVTLGGKADARKTLPTNQYRSARLGQRAPQSL